MTPPHENEAAAILKELQQEIGQRNYHHWFHEQTRLAITEADVIVGVGSPFLLSWMQKQFRGPLARAARTVLGPSARVRFEVDARISLPTANGEAAASSAQKPRPLPVGPAARRSPPAGERPRRRFAELPDFVPGRCNELAITAARRVAEAPGGAYNPLYLHGGVGVGKTHLLEGTYTQLRRNFPSLHVTFLTAEAFANYFTQALREHTLPGFRQRFRSVDVLLVDDIDFLDGKRGIQEEFLHTFQQLESHGRQLVLTADRHPRLLTKLSDELVTRFLSGLVCRLEIPDFETRRRIVQQKALRLNGSVAAEAFDFIAERFKNNVRELEGALNCLETYHDMTGKKVSLTAARQVLADLERDCIRIVRLGDVERAVCSLFGLQPEDLKSSRRHRSVSHPRMVAMFLARKHTRAPYSEIGHYFGGRKHSTVLAAERRVERWLRDETPIQVAAENWPLGEVLESIECQLQAG